MKKYEKPQIILEQFEVSRNVADCAWTMNHGVDGNCTGNGSDYGLPTLFNDGVCDWEFEVETEEICYYPSQGELNIFMS